MKLERMGRQGAQIEAVLPKQIGGRANPEGWQMVAGGRSGLGGNDHREATLDSQAPWRGARPSPDCNCLARSSRLHSDESGTPAGVQDICYVVTRRSPPPNPRRPPATLLQPFGLTEPECPNSAAGWIRFPSNGRAIWAHALPSPATRYRIHRLAVTGGLAWSAAETKA